MAVADRVRPPMGATEIGGSTVPRCSASQTPSQRARVRGDGRNSLSNWAARWGSRLPAIASSGMSRAP